MADVVLSRRAILSDTDIAFLKALRVSQMPFNEVAAVTALHPDILKKLVKDKVLAGDKSTCDIDQARTLAGQLAAARSSTEGKPITALEAAQRYKFSTSTLYSWVEAGWVRVLESTPVGDKLYNEGDLAFARALADLVGHKAGKPVFPPRPRSGRPRKNTAK